LRSRNFNRIVSVHVYADKIGDVIDALREMHTEQIDYAQENDGQYDVWAWNDSTPDDQHEWRLCVHVVRPESDDAE
jgi:hypothetical protein